MRPLVLFWLLLPALVWGQTPINEGEFLTHSTNPPQFGTPIATGTDGAIYVCYIDPDLDTRIARKHPVTGVWSETVLEPLTQADAFHTQCSVGLDAAGYVHVVYNMHNTPWQYKRSDAPHSIASMTFLGQNAGTIPGKSSPQDGNCTGQCAIDWNTDEPGIAAIPGNQITYPHFANDAAGRLYLAFRQCYLCSAAFHSREWSAGLVVYDTTTQTWSRVGGVRPFAHDTAKLPLGVTMFGDAAGRLHAAWVWCNHYTQAEGAAPCETQPNFVTYAYTDDGGATWRQSNGTAMTLPLSPTGSETVVGPSWFDDVSAAGYFQPQTQMMASLQAAGRPFLLVQPHISNSPLGISRGYVRYTAGAWTYPPVNIGFSPSIFYEDALGVWTAVSSGLRLHRSTNQGTNWTVTTLDTTRGSFSVAYDKPYLHRTNRLRLYANRGASGLLVIWTIPYDGPPPLERVRLPRKVIIAEVCGNSLDDNYNGTVDEGC